jgi:hypothetical protein
VCPPASALFTPPSRDGTITRPGAWGGANWGGGASDPETGILYFKSVGLGGVIRIQKYATRDRARPVDAKYTNRGAPSSFHGGIPFFKPPCVASGCDGPENRNDCAAAPFGDISNLRKELEALVAVPRNSAPRRDPDQGRRDFHRRGRLRIPRGTDLWAPLGETTGTPMTQMTRSGRWSSSPRDAAATARPWRSPCRRPPRYRGRFRPRLRRNHEQTIREMHAGRRAPCERPLFAHQATITGAGELRQLHPVAPLQRQFLHCRGLMLACNLRGADVEQGRFARHGHRLAQLRDVKHYGNRRVLADEQLDLRDEAGESSFWTLTVPAAASGGELAARVGHDSPHNSGPVAGR